MSDNCFYSTCGHAAAAGNCAQCGVLICENHARVYKVREFLPPELSCVDLNDEPLHVADEIEDWIDESTKTEPKQPHNGSITTEPYRDNWWSSRT